MSSKNLKSLLVVGLVLMAVALVGCNEDANGDGIVSLAECTSSGGQYQTTSAAGGTCVHAVPTSAPTVQPAKATPKADGYASVEKAVQGAKDNAKGRLCTDGQTGQPYFDPAGECK